MFCKLMEGEYVPSSNGLKFRYLAVGVGLDPRSKRVYGSTLGPVLVSVCLTRPDQCVFNLPYAVDFPSVSSHPQLPAFERAIQALR